MQPPPYWADCPLIGRPIEGTPFITAKTPIQPYNPDSDAVASASSSAASSSSLPRWSIPAENTFTLSMLIRYHQQRGLQLGMIVDLTDGRFYEPQPLCGDNNITYINMYIPPPPADTPASPPTAAASTTSSSSSSSPPLPYGLTAHYLSAFFQLLDTFTASHPSSYLLLHDIYSFDLSLYLLTLYLTTNSLPPSLAYHRTCSSRPPGIADEAMVRHVWMEGGEELEWDVTAVLKRPEWMGDEVTNWTWSGVGDRMEKRPMIEADKAAGKESKVGEVEEKKEPIRPAGTVRRKQPKKTGDGAATAAASSTPLSSSMSTNGPSVASSSISIASSSDPYADMLADIGLASATPIATSSSASTSASGSSSSSGSHKRKAPSSSSPPTRSAPHTTVSSTPSPPPHTNGVSSASAPSTASQPVHKRHSYLVAVQQPHLQRLLSTLLHLVLVPSSHYPASSFPQSSPTDIRAKLVMLASWLERRPVTRDVLDTMVRERSQWSLTWSPVSDECLVLIVKEGTFLLFVSAFSAAATSSTPSPSSLPPLYHVPHLSFPTKSSPTTLVSNTVAVGSLLFDVDQRSPTSPPTPRLLLTDLLSSPAHHPLPPSLSHRIAALDTDIVLPRAQQRSVGGGSGKASVLHVRCKKYFPLSKLASVLSMPVPHEKEGVEVWREAGDNRRGGRVWVWKKQETGITEAELLAAMR